MRVVHILNVLVRAGAEMFVVRLARAQARSGLDVEVVVLQHADPYVVEEARADGIPVHVWQMPKYSTMCAFRLRRFISQQKFDVVHAHLFPVQLWAALGAASLRGKPLLVTTEHSTYNRRRARRLWRLVDCFMYKPYQAVVCVSQATMDSLLAWLPRIRACTSVIENGIDLEAIRVAPVADLAELTGLPRPIVLCVGRLDFEKGQDMLIKALPSLTGISLMLAGTGAKLAEWRALASRLGVEDRVCFFGATNMVYALMKGCDLYVQPSRFEGFGLAALEAVACGAKVIASDVPGLRDVVQHRAVLFQAENAPCLIAKITKAIEGVCYSETKHAVQPMPTIEMAAAKYQALYSTLLGRVGVRTITS